MGDVDAAELRDVDELEHQGDAAELRDVDEHEHQGDAAELRDVDEHEHEHQGDAARVERLKNKSSTTMTEAIADACFI